MSEPLFVKVLVCLCFLLSWVLLMFPVRMGRATAAMLGAALATAIQYFADGFENVLNGVDLSTLALLLGQFIIAYYVMLSKITETFAKWLAETPSNTVKVLKFCLVVSILSPLLMNDTVCILLTRCTIMHSVMRKTNIDPEAPVAELDDDGNLNSDGSEGKTVKDSKKVEILGHVMALGIATCSNIGSAITATGNPQNGLVVSLSGMNAGVFIAGCILPSLVALLLNVGLLVLYYRFLLWRLIRAKVSGEKKNDPVIQDRDGETFVLVDGDCGSDSNAITNTRGKGPLASKKFLRILVGCTLVALLVLVTALRVDPGWAALGCGIFLIVATNSEGDSVLTSREIDYPLLLIFVGQFILVQRLVDTQVPQLVLNNIFQGFETIETGLGLVVLSIVVIVASNIFSNVPVILMLAQVNVGETALISSNASWLAVAWFSTIAGNLLLLGSAANLIVVRQLAERGLERRLTAFSHAKFGIPSTLCVWLIGLVYFQWILPAMNIL